jgi:dTDP-4-dehydrorhamnose 3,5-epimerase
MQVSTLRLQGLKLVSPRVFRDPRGFFFENYRESLYRSEGIDCSFVQDNSSFSTKGTVRGLHYQLAPGQAKLVSCLSGKIWDVAVDIRPDSPTFGRWEAVELDGESHQQLFIPVGFAHGFCVLSDEAIVQYKVSAPYDPLLERSILWNDPFLSVPWPIQHPILSDRDQKSPLFLEVFK